MYSLKNYQRAAIDKIKKRLEIFLSEDEKNSIVFKSPTGSGKTFMISSLFEEFIEENKNQNFCMIWASPGKGDLHLQSYNSVKTYTGGNPTCSLLEEEFFGSRKFIKNKEFIFFNWEKLVQKDKETGKWANNLMKDQEGYNFIDVLNQTRKNNTKIILIIDESHIGSSQKTRIKEFVETIVCPNITIEMSATPLSDHVDVEVKLDDVIAEGMIKSDIIVNEGISSNDQSLPDKDSELIVLEYGYNKRQQLCNEYNKVNSVVNPLVLIQIPNVEEGEAKKLVIKDFLREKGVTEENGKLKLWCDKSANFDKKKIKDNNDITEYLVFKTAVATGWDCPRAHILLKFREGKSETFETQTIGRILRTAEARSYENEILDSAYIYTNITKFETTHETYNPNKIKTEFSKMREPYTQLSVWEDTQLISFYRSRQGDYNSADSNFGKYLIESFMKYFDLEENDKFVIAGSLKDKFVKKGMVLEIQSNDKIIEETHVEIQSVDLPSTTEVSQISVQMAENDIRSKYYTIIDSNLNGLAPVRSRSPINSAIIDLFSIFYNVFDRTNKVKNIQKIVVNNENIMSQIINEATINFRKSISNADQHGETYEFKIMNSRPYSIETHTILTSKKSLYQPLYVLKNENGEPDNLLEKEFIEYLDNCDNVEWFWENGTELMKINFGISYNNGMNTFQPDFIVKFNNGAIGIFDTKPINYRIEDTTVKSNALQHYIEIANKDRTNMPPIIGAIIIKKNNHFMYYSEKEYHDYDENSENWCYFNDILKTK